MMNPRFKMSHEGAAGSTFVGQMFNTNPSSFYMFESLDALCSALDGTSPGWNVPSDITAHAS